jgi:hypothetical protein
MTIDIMRDGRSFDISELNITPRVEGDSSKEDARSVISMIDSEADLIARFSVGGTPIEMVTNHFSDLRSPEEQDRQDRKIAEVLSRIPLDDKKLEKQYLPPIDLTKATDDQIAHMTAIAAGKAKAFARNAAVTREEENAFSSWADRIGEKIGEIIAKVGGKKGLAIMGSTGLLIATACNLARPTEPSRTSTQVVANTPQATETYTPTVTATATETRPPTKEPIYTIAEFEKADVFKAETFPDRFKKVAEDPVSSTDKEWQDYQVWTEALREKFFKQEGFTVNLKNIIDPENMTSLWKMFSWQEKNKDRIVKEDIRVLATPQEIVSALNNSRQIVQSWKGPLFEGDGYREYGIWSTFGPPNYPNDPWIFGYPYFNSDYIPGLLLKRKNAKIPRNEFSEVVGDVAGVAWGRYGSDDETIVFFHLLNGKKEHALFPLIFPYGKIIFPEGTYCVDDHDKPTGIAAGEHTKPMTLPKEFSYKGQHSPEYFLALLGKTIQVSEINTIDDPSMENALEKKYGIINISNPLHPYFSMEMGGYVVDWHGAVENPSPKWPYDEFP